jgi:hypothetical protein
MELLIQHLRICALCIVLITEHLVTALSQCGKNVTIAHCRQQSVVEVGKHIIYSLNFGFVIRIRRKIS